MENEIIEVKIKDIGTFSLEKGESVLSMLRKEKYVRFSNCGGKGTCGRCRIRFLKGATLPMPGDRRRYSPEELREGFRLACLAKPQVNCELELLFPESSEFILTKSVINRQQGGSSESYTYDNSIGVGKGHYMIITDLGTTTIVMQLIETVTGRILETYTEMNPQRMYGADVISRMQHAMNCDAEVLSACVKSVLIYGINKWEKDYPIHLMIISCNTVMSHLLMKYDVTQMSHAPFHPYTVKPIETKISAVYTVILPAISAFVGGDIVAGLLTCEKQMKTDHINKALLIDLGTNGEIALISPEKIICTATAAGPAFEGGANVNIPGSDVIAAVYELLRKRLVDSTGLLHKQYYETGVTVDGIHLMQKDIRNLQMAKAAILAGIQVLMKKCNVSVADIDKVYLAGGFGYKLSVKAAVQIGLLPSQLESRTEAVGNTSLTGAYLYGLSYIKGQKKTESQQKTDLEQCIINRAKSINLAEQKEFNDLYINAMSLEEKEI